MSRESVEKDLLTEKKQMFFKNQIIKLDKLIDILIEFRMDLQIYDKNEIRNYFNLIKTEASIFGYSQLAEIAKYYEDYIDNRENINDNSHEFFSNIVKAVGTIKRKIDRLQNNIDEKKFKYDIRSSNLESSKSKKGNVLLLDDDKLISAILKNEFEKEGYNMMTTTDPEKAIEHILYKDINVALIDIVMPTMNGFEVLEILKKNDLDIPIIFLSGKSTINYKVEALSKGVDDYITKPFEIKEVIARVERSLGRSKQYKDKINVDKLTFAYTKQFFNEYVSNILNNNKHIKGDYCVAFLDLDDFKHINDNYGHVIGDYILRDFVSFAKKTLQGKGIIFRFGGDEFIIIFENQSLIKAYRDLEVLREKLSRNKFVYKEIEKKLEVSVSIGITFIEQGDSIESLLNRADKCLYKSKKLGKNTTMFADK